MRIALFADIHSNREALTACMADAAARAPDRYVFMGDYVGYGADPAWTVDTVRGFVERGAIAVMGNHDHAVRDRHERMTSDAAFAINWSRGQLDDEQRAFLSGLPLRVVEDDRDYRHADGVAPRQWRYVVDADDALRCFRDATARITILGHVHVPAVFALSETGKLTQFRPVAEVPVPLARHRRWILVLGAIGQPRDGNPAASYAMFDTELQEITYLRVGYDIETAAAKIRAAGLPEMLAARLRLGL